MIYRIASALFRCPAELSISRSKSAAGRATCPVGMGLFATIGVSSYPESMKQPPDRRPGHGGEITQRYMKNYSVSFFAFGISKVNLVSSGVEVTESVPACAFAI